MKQITLLIIFLISFSAFSQKQETDEWNYSMKRKFIIEDQILVYNLSDGFFQIFNNEVSISYGLTKFLAMGAYFDYDYAKHPILDASNHLFGIRGTVSVMPLLTLIKNADFLKRVDLNINSYIAYSTGSTNVRAFDKKDNQFWPVYFRIGAKYYITRQFYVTTSVGAYNTNRFFLGAGIKL